MYGVLTDVAKVQANTDVLDAAKPVNLKKFNLTETVDCLTLEVHGNCDRVVQFGFIICEFVFYEGQ